MSHEEKHIPPEESVPGQSPPHAPASDAPTPGGTASSPPWARKKSAVVTYLAILFAAAFLLLLLAFFMQQRTNEAAIGSLRESITSFESLDEVLDDNRSLREENEEFRQRIAALEGEVEQLNEINRQFQTSIDGLTDALSHQEVTAQRAAQAMDLFWQIDEAYVLGRYSLCRELLAQMEESEEDPLKDYLPAESTTGTNRYSPAQRYEEIAAALS